MNQQQRLYLIRGPVLGGVYGLVAFWLTDWQVGMTILLAQMLFQIAMIFIFPKLSRSNLLHLAFGFCLLVLILAIVGAFYVQIKYR